MNPQPPVMTTFKAAPQPMTEQRTTAPFGDHVLGGGPVLLEVGHIAVRLQGVRVRVLLVEQERLAVLLGNQDVEAMASGLVPPGGGGVLGDEAAELVGGPRA